MKITGKRLRITGKRLRITRKRLGITRKRLGITRKRLRIIRKRLGITRKRLGIPQIRALAKWKLFNHPRLPSVSPSARASPKFQSHFSPNPDQIQEDSGPLGFSQA